MKRLVLGMVPKNQNNCHCERFSAKQSRLSSEVRLLRQKALRNDRRKAFLRQATVIFFVLSILHSITFSQSVLIHGYVRDAGTGEVLPFANITIPESGIGTASNKFGFFALNVESKPNIRLRISYVGYESFDTLFVNTQTEILLNVRLRQRTIDIDEVQVVGEGRFYDKSAYPSVLIFRGKDFSSLPSPGEKDLLRALQRYPGISFQSEMSSSIYVRGGTPDQTLIQLDGMTVYNPSHVFGFFSMFNNDAIKAAKVMKGGFPAEFGTRNGSVLDILSLEGDRSKLGGKASFGLINGSLFLNGPVWNGSWMVSARRSYLDFVKSIGLPIEIPDYVFYDLHARMTQDLDEKNKISLTTLYNVDDLDYVSANNVGAIDEAIYSTWSNRLLGVEWASTLSSSAFLRTIVSHSQYSGNLDATQNVLLVSFPGGNRLINYANQLDDFSLKSELDLALSQTHTLKAGGFLTNYKFSYSTNASFEGNTSKVLREYYLAGMFLQDEVKISDDLDITPGFRLTKYAENNDLYFEPRLVVGYQFTPTILLRLGSGAYYQWLNGGQPASYLTFSGIDFWFPVGEAIKPSRSTQFSTDVLWNLNPSVLLTLCAYTSSVSNLVELRPNFEESSNLGSVFFSGRGKNYGVEAMVEANWGSLRGMAGYTLSWANRWFPDIEEGSRFPARHDKRHVVDVVFSYTASETWELSCAWTFSTGQAYTGILGYYELGGLSNKRSSGGNGLHFLLSRRNAFRLPYYHRLDLGATKTFDYESWKLRLRIDIFNAYSRRNALGATTGFSDDPYYRFFPIVPTFTLEAEF